jgi:aspartyl protease family protein
MTDQQEHPTQQAGKTMMVLACLVALGLLTAFFSNWEENAYNPNTNPSSQQTAEVNSVILERNRHHHYVSAGSINTQAVTFLLDTGATDVVIPEGLAKQLALSYGPRQQASTANGIIDVYQTLLKQLTIGTITLYNVDASINPSMQGKQILLGMSALKNIEFTQRGEQLTLRQYR